LSLFLQREAEFAFGFDETIEPIALARAMQISGWLVDTGGQPIHGIREIMRMRLRPRWTKRARRKRNRPDVAAQFPEASDAQTSGFLVELPLRVGRNEIILRVQDRERRWRTFF
jgi:hypothetical protein